MYSRTPGTAATDARLREVRYVVILFPPPTLSFLENGLADKRTSVPSTAGTTGTTAASTGVSGVSGQQRTSNQGDSMGPFWS